MQTHILPPPFNVTKDEVKQKKKQRSIYSQHLLIYNRLEICSFSGQKIYPAKGKTYVRIDSR